MEGEEGLFNVDGVDFDNFTLPVGLDEDKGGNWSDFYPPECVNLTGTHERTLVDKVVKIATGTSRCINFSSRPI